MQNSEANPSLVELAEEITKNAKVLDAYITEKGLPKPTFASDGPLSFPVPQDDHEMQAARLALIGASRSLLELTLGPLQRLNLEVPTVCKICPNLLDAALRIRGLILNH
jgi:hypothetical protein